MLQKKRERRERKRKREVDKERMREKKRALMTYNTCRTQYRDLYIFLYIH